MATLAENFLADLDELSEGEEEEQQQQQQEDEKEEEEKGNGDDKVCLFSSSSVFDAAVALSLSRSLARFRFFSPPEARRADLISVHVFGKTLTKVKHAHENKTKNR